jgi:DNA-binding XRE family transcriptional regulator
MMRHRALDYPPDTSPRELGTAALDELIARGDLDDWEPVLAEVRRDPDGAVAARVERLLDGRPDDGSTALWRAFLAEARRDRPPQPVGSALRAARERRGRTQAEVASRLHATQPEISKLERRRDARVSTVRAYVEALGGRLRMVVVFHDEELELGGGK